jgi:NADH:ubiquinone oxidoreductase subunit 2 (subunit N)
MGVLLQISSVMAVLIGLGGLSQTKIKIILALTSTTQIGYVLGGLSVWTPASRGAALFYFFLYLLQFVILVAIFSYLERNKKMRIIYISDLRSVYSQSFYFWLVIIIVLISIAGLPFSGIFLLKF